MHGSDTTAKRSATYAVVAGLGTALLFGGVILTARGQDAPQTPAAAAAVESGRKRFEQSCGFCHGADATGARGPDLVRSSLVAHDVKGDLIGQVIRNGRPDKGMPPMPLADDQIAEIAAFLHSRATESMESSSVPNAYALEKMLTGNATLQRVTSRVLPASIRPSSFRPACSIRAGATRRRS
jgi:mono/diheme cytochrome c family protein